MFSAESIFDTDYRQPSIKSLVNDPGKKDIREEMILYFYSAMLPCLIHKQDRDRVDSSQDISMPKGGNTCIADSEILLMSDVISSNRSVSREPDISDIKSEQFMLSRSKKSLKTLKKTRHFKQRMKRTLLGPPELSFDKSNFSWCVERFVENVKIKFTNENMYEGQLYGNKLHGQGRFTWSNGTVYEGEFENNEITGVGRFVFPDQTIYSGDVYKNYLHGNGLLFPATSPCIYKGAFHLNIKHGFGWQLFSDNNTYEGGWADGLMNGEGCRRYPSGAIYYGNFLMGKRHGFGVAVLKNQDVYSGDWIQGDKDGFGDYIWNLKNENYFAAPVQSCYFGSWIENKREGIGVINFGWQGGSRYAGYFSNNEKHGSGVIICENGHVIESNPLFVNDKPVHLSDSGDIETSPHLPSSASSNDILSVTSNLIYLDDPDKQTRQNNLIKRFPLELRLQCTTPTEEERSAITLTKYINIDPPKQNKYNAEVYNSVFPKIRDQYSSLSIPIGISSERIDLNAYIYKIIEFKSDNKHYNKELEVHFKSCTSSVDSDYELHKLEERMIRKSISKYLGQLKRIYQLYAKIGCIEKQTTNEFWLIRIFFWQLYRDCRIPEKGISLIDIDLMFSEKSTFDFYVVHNPFEIIYFWQFLESLLYVALTLYGENFINSNEGVLKQSFEYLMDKDILPNAGHFQGSALFEYRDVIPIKAAYEWYKSIGEPHTAKEFFKNICKSTTSKRRRRKSLKTYSLPYIQRGYNAINLGNKVFYFEDEYIIPTQPTPPKLKSIQHENPKKLYFLSSLKPKRVANILHTVCPAIKINKDILNFEYKLCFLEFYEMVLLCTQQKVKVQKREVRRFSHSTQVESTQLIKKRKRISMPRKLKIKAQG